LATFVQAIGKSGLKCYLLRGTVLAYIILDCGRAFESTKYDCTTCNN